MVTCADLLHTRDGRKVVVPGVVLMRQKPGSAKGVMSITIEDETGMANLVLRADRVVKQRPLVLSAGMIACHGRVQREGEVLHVVPDMLEDLSGLQAGRRAGEEGGAGDLHPGPAARVGQQGADARFQVRLLWSALRRDAVVRWDLITLRSAHSGDCSRRGHAHRRASCCVCPR